MENVPVYCGNNRLDLEVQTGRQVLGTRHKCLKKGFGTGYYVVAPNRSLMLPYEPLVNDRFYCGNKNELPNGYTRFGTLSQCFSKGVGAGMRKKAVEIYGDAPDEPDLPDEIRIDIPYNNSYRRRPDVGMKRRSRKRKSTKKIRKSRRKSQKKKRKSRRRSYTKKRKKKIKSRRRRRSKIQRRRKKSKK